MPPSEASAPGSMGKNKPWSRSCSLSALRVMPGSTTQSRSSACTASILFMSRKSIDTPPSGALMWPSSEVPTPNGMTGTPFAAQMRTICCTSCVVCGYTTASGGWLGTQVSVLPCCSRTACEVTTRLPNAAVSAAIAAAIADGSRACTVACLFAALAPAIGCCPGYRRGTGGGERGGDNGRGQALAIRGGCALKRRREMHVLDVAVATIGDASAIPGPNNRLVVLRLGRAAFARRHGPHHDHHRDSEHIRPARQSADHGPASLGFFSA